MTFGLTVIIEARDPVRSGPPTSAGSSRRYAGSQVPRRRAVRAAAGAADARAGARAVVRRSGRRCATPTSARRCARRPRTRRSRRPSASNGGARAAALRACARARRRRRRVPRAELHARAGADLRVDRRRLRRGDDGRPGRAARAARRRHRHRRQRGGDDGVRVAVVGAARVVLAADRAAAAAPGPQPEARPDARSRSLVAGRRSRSCRSCGLPAFYESFLYLVFHWIVLATSWNILSRLLGLLLVRPRRVLRRRRLHDGGARRRASTCRSCGRCRPRRSSRRCSALGSGAVVFRVRHVRGELFALLTLAVTFVLGDDRPQHADRRRARAST